MRRMKSPTRFLTPKDLPDKGINYHPNHLRLLWQSGKFPPPTQLSPRKIAWPEEVIDAWMHSKITGQHEPCPKKKPARCRHTGTGRLQSSQRSNHHTSSRLGLKAPPQKAAEAETALAAALRKALARKGGAR